MVTIPIVVLFSNLLLAIYVKTVIFFVCCLFYGSISGRFDFCGFLFLQKHNFLSVIHVRFKMLKKRDEFDVNLTQFKIL